MSKKVYIFLADGFEDIEGLTVVDLLRRAGIDIKTVSIKETKQIQTSHGITMLTDTTFAAGTALHSWQAVAQGKSSIAHKGMLYAARIMALTAIDFLQKPELVNKAREELTETLNGETYPDPLPKDLKPEIW